MTVPRNQWARLVNRHYAGRWPVEGTTFTACSTEVPLNLRVPMTWRVVYGPHGWHAVRGKPRDLGTNRYGSILLSFPDAVHIFTNGVFS